MAIDTHRPGVGLVVLVASAGGLDAISAVLGGLPVRFGAAVVVQQHLGAQSSVLPTILRRSTRLPVAWARSRQSVEAGQVVVCPPNMHMEIKPDRTCRLRTMKCLTELRFDVLLASVANSYGPRGLTVVLSGSGRDAARGVVAMKHAEAVVIAQSPGSADYPSMPIAAIEAGADLVLPTGDIGTVLASIVEGAPLPCPPRDPPAPSSGGERMKTGEAAGASHGGSALISPSRIIEGAVARAEAARTRAAELRCRRQDLAAGLGATAQSVAVARRRAEESLRRAVQAQQAAKRAAAQQAD
ncbi:hypothetical protein A5647_07685 [Mycobacterium sp. 1100029.7]|nr:hypothetical protein A5647_07685 [Mycobacterium sp. 1100029.7]